MGLSITGCIDEACFSFFFSYVGKLIIYLFIFDRKRSNKLNKKVRKV